MPLPTMLTVGVLARRLDVANHQVLYLLRHLKIRPLARAGSAHVFDESVVPVLAAELRRRSKAATGERRQQVQTANA